MQTHRTLYLARHGETVWNRQGRLQGRSGSPLTERGEQQARSLAAAATHLGIERVISSPLGRARRTAEVIAAALDVAVEERQALVEIDFGVCSGTTLAEAEQAHGAFFEARRTDHWNTRWPGGESYADAAERLQRWLDGERDLGCGASTLLVAHQSVLRAFLVTTATCSREDVMASRLTADEVVRVGSGVEYLHAGRAGAGWISGLPRAVVR